MNSCDLINSLLKILVEGIYHEETPEELLTRTASPLEKRNRLSYISYVIVEHR